jgi:hypothetical protein
MMAGSKIVNSSQKYSSLRRADTGCTAKVNNREHGGLLKFKLEDTRNRVELAVVSHHQFSPFNLIGV